MRLHRIAPEFEGRVTYRTRAFPLELLRGESAPRDILEQEWWLASIQEPAAKFAPYPAEDWPTTTLPAFDAVHCAAEQGASVGRDYDLRVRTAFFGEGRNIGRPEVLFDIAREAGLDMARFQAAWDSGAARPVVLAEAEEARTLYKVHGTPTLMLSDGSRLKLPIAFPHLKNRRIVSIDPAPCIGAACDDAIRALFERALATA